MSPATTVLSAPPAQPAAAGPGDDGAPVPPARPRVLSVAGTDPTGGAGVQADLKTFAAHGAYGMAVTTALVAQNTHGVRAAHVPGPAFLRAQLDAVSDDVAVDAVKIGMVADAANAREIAAWLTAAFDDGSRPLVVLDPVMVATSGDRLLDAGAEQAVRDLACHADVVTPNLPELAVLLDEPAATTWDVALDQAARLAARTGARVLLKGGHLDGGTSPDALVAPDGDVVALPGERVSTRHTHGTGCTLSAALAALAPVRAGWPEAAREAKDWLTGALRAGAALQVGTGRGPVDHQHASTAGRRPFAADAWERAAGWRAAVDGTEFVVRLADGTLPAEAFAFYLAQDAAYLVEYARVLSAASRTAPTPHAQELFATSALAALQVERSLHHDWLAEHAGMDADAVGRVEPSPVTAAYTNHLHAAAAGSFGETVAALLPCYTLYAHVGQTLLRRAAAGNPYARWIATYGDPGFAESTRRAEAVADEAARWASPQEHARMLRAYEISCQHEHAFFAQGLTRPAWPRPPHG